MRLLVTASDLGLGQASDLTLLNIAIQDNRVLVTRDRDFGGLVFVNAIQCGVIYLRALPSTLNIVHAELIRVLDHYKVEKLAKSLIVVEPGRHRLRRITI